MSKFEHGDIVRYTAFGGGIGIYLGYDKDMRKHVIGCSGKREESILLWALYMEADGLELLERPNIRLLNAQATEPTEPTVLEDLIDEL